MKNASKLRLSLRKLLIATLAVGPLAVLPAPVWAAVPPTNTGNVVFTVTSGTASYSSVNAGAVANIVASDRAVLTWNGSAFNIGSADTFSFILPSSSASVLNKVGYKTDGTLDTAANAVINGELTSNGRVFILANGNIQFGATSTVNTAGLVLSTISESTDGAYTSLGNLSYIGDPRGTITLDGVNVAGSLTATSGSYAQISTRAGAKINGDLILSAVSGGMTLASNGALDVAGNLSVTTANGTVSQGALNVITVGATGAASAGVGSQTASFTTGTGSVTLNGAANNFQTVLVTSTGDVNLKDSDIIRLGTSTMRDLTVEAAGGAASTTAIASTGTLTIGRDATFSAPTAGTRSAVSIANNSTVGGTFAATVASNASVTFNGTGNVTVGAVSTGTGSGAGVTINTTGAVALNNAISTTGSATAGGTITVTGTSVSATAGSSLTTAGVGSGGVSINATAGNITASTISTTAGVTLNASTGNITQVNPITSTGNLTVRSVGDAVLTNAANAVNGGRISANITGGGAGSFAAATTAASGLTLNLTATGNVSVTSTDNKAIVLGVGAGTSAVAFRVDGNLSLSTGGTITDNDYSSISVLGSVTLDSPAVLLNAAVQNGALSPRVTLGAISGGRAGGFMNIAETTTINLGNISAESLVAQSSTGGIVDSGLINVANGLFSVTGNNSVVLADNTVGATAIVGGADHSVSNSAASTIGRATITTPASITSGAADVSNYNTSVTGNVSASTTGTAALTLSNMTVGNLTATSGGTLSINGNVSVTTNATLTAAGETNQTQRIVVGNTATLNGTGEIKLDTNANDFGSVVLNAGDAAKVNDVNGLTVSGTVTKGLTVKAGTGGTVANNWALTLGNLSASTLDLAVDNGVGSGSGNSGSITQQSGTTLRSEGTASFLTRNGTITIDNSGNSFGRINASTSGAAATLTGTGSITIRESGTMKIGVLGANGTNATLTSELGSIIEDVGSDTGSPLTTLRLTSGTLTLNSANGSITLDNSTRTGAGTNTFNVSTVRVDAPTGSVKISSLNDDFSLGNISANSLSVIHSGANNTTQSGRLNVFGSFSINSTSTGNITLTNSTNNFGRISLVTASTGSNISLTEAATVNLGTVTMPAAATGNVTITSVNGDIIDTGLAGVKLGGGNGVTTGAQGTGNITLTASKGNITLDDPTTDFQSTRGVVFTANNVVLSPLGVTTLVLGNPTGTATATGNLTVLSATGSINQNGPLAVTGDAQFQTGGKDIILTNTSNNFGSVRFTGNVVRVAEASDMLIATGSSAIGGSEFSSGGNLTIANRGGVVTFGTSGAQTILTATGSITLPKLVQSTGTIILNAAGTKDLSALSLTADLAGKAPTNLGAGSYLPPSP